jgi:uroporphyrinogen decarboxylase
MSKFLDALQGSNRGAPPIWLMRQAGRYLPEYRALRALHPLRELFFTPHLAAEVTLQPIRRFGFDAAILFSDITAIGPAMGFDLEFREGPHVFPKASKNNWQKLKQDLNALNPIGEAAFLAKKQLDVPLIGFCGGPFTIATYLAEKRWEEEDFQAFLDHIADVCIISLKWQIEAGVDAVQIFDSWANLLSDEEFEEYSLKPLRKIIAAIDTPVLIFMRGAAKRVERLMSLKPAAISVDWERSLAEIRRTIKVPLQGNLNPDLLFQPTEQIRREVRILLEEMRGDHAFIVNLGHGVKPGTPLEAVAALVETVRQHEYSTNYEERP